MTLGESRAFAREKHSLPRATDAKPKLQGTYFFMNLLEDLQLTELTDEV